MYDVLIFDKYKVQGTGKGRPKKNLNEAVRT